MSLASTTDSRCCTGLLFTTTFLRSSNTMQWILKILRRHVRWSVKREQVVIDWAILEHFLDKISTLGALRTELKSQDECAICSFSKEQDWHELLAGLRVLLFFSFFFYERGSTGPELLNGKCFAGDVIFSSPLHLQSDHSWSWNL